MQTSVGIDRSVGKSAGTVPADSTAAETVDTEDDMLVGEGPAGVGADTAAVSGNFSGSESVGTRGSAAAAQHGRCDVLAGINAVAEAAEQTEDLVVSKARLEGDFRDEIGRRVEGVSRGIRIRLVG